MKGHNDERVESETFGGTRIVRRRTQALAWFAIDDQVGFLLDECIPPRDIAWVLRLYAWHILSRIN